MNVSRSSYYEWAAGKSARRHEPPKQTRGVGARQLLPPSPPRRNAPNSRRTARCRSKDRTISNPLADETRRLAGDCAPQAVCAAHDNLESRLRRQSESAGRAGEPAAGAAATVIVGDITYLPLQSGQWCYLASWQDKFTRRIVGSRGRGANDGRTRYQSVR